MPRKKGDGRGRLGGRTAGTPNKDKPLKTFLRQHSIDYFTPTIEEDDDKGEKTGRTLSQFDIDCMALDPATASMPKSSFSTTTHPRCSQPAST